MLSGFYRFRPAIVDWNVFLLQKNIPFELLQHILCIPISELFFLEINQLSVGTEIVTCKMSLVRNLTLSITFIITVHFKHTLLVKSFILIYRTPHRPEVYKDRRY